MSTDVMIYADDLSKRFGNFARSTASASRFERGDVVGFLGRTAPANRRRCASSPASSRQATHAQGHGHDVFTSPSGRRKLGNLPSARRSTKTCWSGTTSSSCRDARSRRVHLQVAHEKGGRGLRPRPGARQGHQHPVPRLSATRGPRAGAASRPPILILDEPTSALDPNEKAEVIRTSKNRQRAHHFAVDAQPRRGRNRVREAIIHLQGSHRRRRTAREIRAARARFATSCRSASSWPSVARRHGHRSAVGAERRSPVFAAVTELPTRDKAHAFELGGPRRRISAATGSGWSSPKVDAPRTAPRFADARRRVRDLTKGDEVTIARWGSTTTTTAPTPARRQTCSRRVAKEAAVSGG